MTTQPQDMLLEVTNRCNHACIFCAHRKMDAKQGEINLEFAKRVMREAFDMGVRRIGLYTTGEMFMCQNIATHVENAKEIGFEYIYSDTNGALATSSNMREVMAAGLDSIKFSINAGTRKTFADIHGKDDFDIVIQNLKDCHFLKNEINKDIKISVSYVVTKQNEDELEILRQLIEPYVDKIIPCGVRSMLLQYDDDLSYLISDKYNSNNPVAPCSMVFNRIHVTYNGFLTACCVDFNYDLILADLNSMALKDAWNSEKAIKLREKHLDGDLKGTMCYNCMSDKYFPYEKYTG